MSLPCPDNKNRDAQESHGHDELQKMEIEQTSGVQLLLGEDGFELVEPQVYSRVYWETKQNIIQHLRPIYI